MPETGLAVTVTDYKHTLNLPKTDFPMRGNLAKREPEKPGKDVDEGEFRAKCREYAGEQIDKQRVEFRRLGVMGDWDQPYLTMNYRNEADIVRALGRIVENGHIYKGLKPVYWSWGAHSAMAEAEVEYHDKTSTAIDVRFAPRDKADVLKRFGLALTVQAHPDLQST